MQINEVLKNQETLTTPFYVFDKDELLKRVSILSQKLPSNATLCYAIKANPFLIPLLQDSGILFEVCSPGELSICQKYNVNPEQIVFSGVCKTYDDVKRAFDFKVKTITLESPLHCEYLIKCIEKCEKPHNQEVILRLTCGNQFGMSKDDILSCIEKLSKLPSIKIRGIHYFTGTQKKLTKILEEVEFINQYCNELKIQTGVDFTDIEYGPGLSYNYFDKEAYSQNFEEFDQFAESLKNSNFNYVIELGRFIASSCGTYVTSIMDVKHDGDKSYCIIDGGINHINYYGQIMGMKVPAIDHADENYNKKTTLIDENTKKYTICGSLCTTADVVLRELALNNPHFGDKLIFKDIGAYSITEGIYLFLSHPLPCVYYYKDGKLTLARNGIETSDINSKNI